MNNRNRILRLVASMIILATLAVPMNALAQAPPPPLGYEITGAISLSDGDVLNKVKQYVAYSVDILKNPSSKPEEVESARARLVQPLTNINVSPAFRYEYSRLVAPELEKILQTQDQNLHTSVNAIIIASMLGSDRAMNFLLANMDKQEQTVWQLRLQAAFGCITMLKGDTLDTRKVLDATRQLRDASTQEDNPIILGRQLEAILAADHKPTKTTEGVQKVTDADRQQIRSYLVEAISSAMDRIAKSTAADSEQMLATVNAAVVSLRDRYIDTTQVGIEEQKTLGQKLAPVLGRMIAQAGRNWAEGQKDEREKRLLSNVVGACEGFLVRIDAVRGASPLSTSLAKAWDSGDKARFDADLAKWTAVLTQPPYAQQ